MTEYSETFQHAGLHVRIYWEKYIETWMSPREDDCGLLGVMFCDHPSYCLGDKNAPDPRGQKIECGICEGTGYDPLASNDPEDSTFGQKCSFCKGDGEMDLGMVEYLRREHGARVILPLFLYDHSGITMSCGGRLDTGQDDFSRSGRFVGDGAGWDTSSVGVIFDTEESRKRCGWEKRTDEEIEADLRSEVKYYAAYLEGSVYGYEVVLCEPDEDGEVDPENRHCEVLASCGGYLVTGRADEENIRDEARGAAEVEREQIDKEAKEAYRWACADLVTV